MKRFVFEYSRPSTVNTLLNKDRRKISLSNKMYVFSRSLFPPNAYSVGLVYLYPKVNQKSEIYITFASQKHTLYTLFAYLGTTSIDKG